MFGFPYFGFPNFYRRPYYAYPQGYYNDLNTSSSKTDLSSSNSYSEGTISTDNAINGDNSDKNADVNRVFHQKNPNNSYFFELFGLKLYFDDILIICLLYFLYSEEVKDEGLFIALILLLIT